MATTVTAGPILSNVAAPLTTSSAAWSTLYTLTRPIKAKKLQIINDGTSTGAARVSIGDRSNPVYVPAGGSLTLEDVMIAGPIEAMRDASTDLVAMKIQVQREGAEKTETQ